MTQMCRQVSNQCKPLCLMCVLGLDIGPSRLATSTTELQVKSMQRCQHEQLQRRWVMCCIPSTENNLALHIQWTHECTHTHTHTRTHTHTKTRTGMKLSGVPKTVCGQGLAICSLLNCTWQLRPSRTCSDCCTLINPAAHRASLARAV